MEVTHRNNQPLVVAAGVLLVPCCERTRGSSFGLKIQAKLGAASSDFTSACTDRDGSAGL